MKQFWTILKFELQSYLKNKIFVGITVLLVGLIAVVMFFPSIMGNGSDINEGDEAAGVEGLMLFSAEGLDDAKLYQTFFEEAFTEYEVGATEDDEERIKERVVSGEAE